MGTIVSTETYHNGEYTVWRKEDGSYQADFHAYPGWAFARDEHSPVYRTKQEAELWLASIHR